MSLCKKCSGRILRTSLTCRKCDSIFHIYCASVSKNYDKNNFVCQDCEFKIKYPHGPGVIMVPPRNELEQSNSQCDSKVPDQNMTEEVSNGSIENIDPMILSSETKNGYNHISNSNLQTASCDEKPIIVSKKIHCDVCNQEFVSRTAFGAHLRTHYAEESFECYYCQTKFNAKNSLTEHIKIEHLKQYYRCAKCSVSFKQKESYKKHKRVHIIKCELCKRKFRSEGFLTTHKCKNKDRANGKIKHRSKKLEKVTYLCCCGKLFNCNELLVVHQVTVHLPCYKT